MIAPSRPHFDTPEISLLYLSAGPNTVGRLENVSVSFATIGGPAALLKDKQVSVSINGVEPWTAMVPLQGIGPDHAMGNEHHRWRSIDFDAPELLGKLAKERSVEISLSDKDGTLISRTLYNVGDWAERDMLFDDAWQQAEQFTHSLDKCTKAEG